MITDILTVAWKELREMLVQGDPRGRSKMSLILLVVIFGIVLPLQNGRDWINSPISILVWGWMPFLWVSGIVADSFAGERERHTLKSLLSTRLSDRAILFGKLLAALLYGCILTWIILLVSLITVNVAYARGGAAAFPAAIINRSGRVHGACLGFGGQHRGTGFIAGRERPSGAAVDERRHAGSVHPFDAGAIPAFSHAPIIDPGRLSDKPGPGCGMGGVRIINSGRYPDCHWNVSVSAQ